MIRKEKSQMARKRILTDLEKAILLVVKREEPISARRIYESLAPASQKAVEIYTTLYRMNEPGLLIQSFEEDRVSGNLALVFRFTAPRTPERQDVYFDTDLQTLIDGAEFEPIPSVPDLVLNSEEADRLHLSSTEILLCTAYYPSGRGGGI